MKNWYSNFLAGIGEMGRAVLRIALIGIPAILISLPVFLYAAVQSGTWQIYAIIASLILNIVVLFFVAALARQNRVTAAVYLMVGTACLVVPTITSLVAGQGLILGIVLLIAVVAITGQALRGKSLMYTLTVAGLFSGITFLIDRFASWDRLNIPALQILSPLIVSGAVIFLGIFSLRPLWSSILPNLSLGRKMAVMVSVLALGIIGVVSTGINSLTTMRYHLGNIYNFMLIPIVTISNAEARLAENQFIIQEVHTEETSASFLESRIQKLRDNDAFAADVIARYQNEWVTTVSPEFTRILSDAGRIDLQQQEVAALDELVTAFQEYNEINEQFLNSLQAGHPNEEMAHIANEKLQVVVDDLRTLIEVNNEFAAISNNAAQGAYRQSNLNMALVVTISLALGIFLSYLIVSSITGRLGELTQSASALQQGRFDQSVSVSGRDEVGFLGLTFNNMAAQLNDLFSTLERRVADRTRDLAIVAEVGTTTATILESSRLLQEVVDLTRERFNLYHAHIYLLDLEGRNLVLTAGAGEPGRVMAAEGRSIPLDREQSLVARAARERQGVTVNDVTQAPDFLPNPLLPDTRSELAVPMIVGGNVIGVFDIQSEQVGRFTDSDVNIQTTLAAQLATSIQNVRSFEQSRKQAEFEAQVNLIGQSIQRATTIEETLQTAVRELGRTVGASRVTANLAPTRQNDGDPPGRN